MGRLRTVPKKKEPGFISFKLKDEVRSFAESNSSRTTSDSNLVIRTKQGTMIQIGREMSLKQVVRLVKMLENRGHHGLG